MLVCFLRVHRLVIISGFLVSFLVGSAGLCMAPSEEGKSLPRGFSHLIRAIQNNDTVEAERLFNRYSIPLKTCDKQGTSLCIHAVRSQSLDALMWLLDNGAPADYEDGQGMTAFDYAVFESFLGAVNVLYKNSPFLATRRGSCGYTPLHWAVKNHKPEVLDWLFENVTDMSTRGTPQLHGNLYIGKTPLWVAARQGNVNMAERLLSKEADHQADEEGKTPLLMAVYGGHMDMVNTLLTYGADPNRVNEFGISPLMVGAFLGHASIVRLLVDSGGLVGLRDYRNKQTAIGYAECKDHDLLAAFLYQCLEKEEQDRNLKEHQNREEEISRLRATIEKQVKESIEQTVQDSISRREEKISRELEKLRQEESQRSKDIETIQREFQEKLASLQQAGHQKHQEEKSTREEITSQLKAIQQRHEQAINQQETLLEELTSLKAQRKQEREETGKDLEKLLKKQRRKEELSAAIQELISCEDTYVFYTHFQRKLNGFLRAYQLIDTGFVEQKKGKSGDAKDATGSFLKSSLKLMGASIPIPGLNLVCGVLGAGVTYLEETRQKKKRKHILELLRDPKATEKEIEVVARFLSLRHKPQLERLEEKGKEKLAEAAVYRFLKFIEAGLLTEEDSLSTQVLEAVNYNTHIPTTKGFMFEKIHLSTKDFSDKKWTEEGVFHRTGIITREGKVFVKEGSKHEKYGYRHGTEAEALHRGYHPLEVPM